MKAITIAGRLGKDPVLRDTANDKVLGFSVAVDDGWGEKRRTLWFDCSVFGKRAETLAKFLTKGTAVAVSGDLSTREYDGKTYLTVRVNDVTLQGGGERREQKTTYDEPEYAQGKMSDVIDDDVPFAPEFR